jgi:hypothetical protein
MEWSGGLRTCRNTAVGLVSGSEPSVVTYRNPPGVAEEICTHIKLFVVHEPLGLLHTGVAAATAHAEGTVTGVELRGERRKDERLHPHKQ